MSADAILTVLESAFDVMARLSLTGGALAAAAWLACRWLSPTAGLEAAVWWLVSLQFVLGLVSVEPLALPVLPAGASPVALRFEGTAGPDAGESARFAVATAEPSTAQPYPWRAALALCWLAGIAAAAVRGARRVHWTSRMRARSAPAWTAARVEAWRLAGQLGLRQVPDVRRSSEIEAPMLVGLVNPIVLLPEGRFDALSDDERRMALCHELLHLRRRDLWWGLVPFVAERIFFFHPLARLAAREYVVARESACDAAVIGALDVGADAYARLLVAMGVARPGARPAAAAASGTFANLQRRIEMLGQPSQSRKAQAAGWALISVLAFAIAPVHLVARSAPAPVAPDAAAVTPVTAPTQQEPVARSSTHIERGDGLDYALLLGDDRAFMNGRIDSRRLRQLSQGARLFWFRDQGQEYVVRDAAAIDEAERINRPLAEIGAKQGEVGSKQGDIGAKQGEVGARQGAIGARQGDIGAKQAAIGAKQGAIGARQARDLSDSERAEIDREQKTLDAQMRELDAQMASLNEEMRRADDPMKELDAQMRVLDEEMRALDRQMEEAVPKVRADMKALIRRLVEKGVAQPVK